MTAATAATAKQQQQQDNSSSSLYYQHEERILVSPDAIVPPNVVVATTTTTTTNGDDDNDVLDLDVVLHERQILRRQRQQPQQQQQQHADTDATADAVVSPFPSVWMLLTKQFDNLQKLTLQVASTASSTHYYSPITTSTTATTTTIHVPNGPAGVRVTAEFVVPNDSSNNNNTDERFTALLHALHYHRLFLASSFLSSSHVARLHRLVVRQQEEIMIVGSNHTHNSSTTSSTNTTAATTTTSSTNTIPTSKATHHLVRYSLTLPTDGGAVLSAEGFRAWMGTNKKQHSKQNAGLFSTTMNHNPLTWSQWMLGVYNNNHQDDERNTKNNKNTAKNNHHHDDQSRNIILGKQRRGLWIDLESSCSSYKMNQNENNNNDDDACTLQLTRGMYYTSRIPFPSSSSPSSSSSLDVALKEILPPGSSPKGLSKLPWAQAPTSVEIVLPEHLRNSVEYRIDPDACLGAGGGVVNTTTHTANNNCKLAQTTTPLNQRLFQLTRRTTTTSKQDTTTTTTRRRPYYSWRVNLNVLRPHGLSNGGTFQTTLWNRHYYDEDCATSTTTAVHVFQRIPEYVTPLWRTLSIQLRQKLPSSSTTSSNSSSSSSSSSSTSSSVVVEKYLEWTDLDQHDIVFQPNGAVDLSFQINNFPKHSQLILSFDYDPKFLYTLEQFAGDPNRGLEVPPVSAVFSCGINRFDNNNNRTVVELTSDTVLLLPPLPDLSMPFNVLSLICTLYVFVVGSLLNLLIRRASQAVQYEYDPDSKPKSKLVVLKEKMRGAVQRIQDRLRRRLRQSSQKGEEETDKPKED